VQHVPDVRAERHAARVRDAEQGDGAPVGPALRRHADDDGHAPHVRVDDADADPGPVDVDATGPATDLVEHRARVHGVGGERAAQLGRPLPAAAPREAEVARPRGAAIVAHGGELSRAGAGEPVERERARVRPPVRAERRPEERPQLEPAHPRRLGADEHRGGRQVVAHGALRGEAPLRPAPDAPGAP
jgi:hypothetical protein